MEELRAGFTVQKKEIEVFQAGFSEEGVGSGVSEIGGQNVFFRLSLLYEEKRH